MDQVRYDFDFERSRVQLRKELRDYTERARKAKAFADSIIDIMGEFIPRKCRDEAHEELMVRAFIIKAEITHSDPVWGADQLSE